MDLSFRNDLREINALAGRLHRGIPEADAFTFGSLTEHVEEVRALLDSGDSHWKAETADIIIHGLLLLDRHGVSPGDVQALVECRLARFKDKINTAQRNLLRGEYGQENSDR